MKLLFIVSSLITVTCFFSCGMAPPKSVASAPTPTPTPTPTPDGQWRVYTPPDKSFSVELTCEPTQTNVSEPSTPIYQYACGPGESVGPHFFAIVVSTADLERNPLDEAAFERSVKDMLTPNKRLIKLVPIKIDGGMGREIVFTNKTDDMDNGRVRVILLGKHRYEVGLPGIELKMLESPVAERFFATFKPLG